MSSEVPLKRSDCLSPIITDSGPTDRPHFINSSESRCFIERPAPIFIWSVGLDHVQELSVQMRLDNSVSWIP
ncbi:hypothetical protein T265_08592 [Opisthorchis viverrini]|uniref:Uncharacterized protein n=1 Tax=Opisthorchis viverrini TaxID=6198 RepID=A0A074ZJK5_OPIVI|nr:hypothetical protein T265_08592 [Opisthorchis viverrini]KER23550.1 hypothetical protein T265_08592 [Opisthorchis viverrini]